VLLLLGCQLANSQCRSNEGAVICEPFEAQTNFQSAHAQLIEVGGQAIIVVRIKSKDEPPTNATTLVLSRHTTYAVKANVVSNAGQFRKIAVPVSNSLVSEMKRSAEIKLSFGIGYVRIDPITKHAFNLHE
jgi:hypothetical protein